MIYLRNLGFLECRSSNSDYKIIRRIIRGNIPLSETSIGSREI